LRDGKPIRATLLTWLAAGLACLCLSAPSPAQTPAPAPHTGGPTRDEKWRQDLRQMADGLARNHHNAFFRVKREEFERAVGELDAAIPALQDHEIVARMTRIGAAIGDAHSGLGWPALFTRRYPLGLSWFKDGLYLTRTVAAHKQHLGSRLVKIGETDVRRAFELLRPFVAHENEPWLLIQSPGYMTTPEFLHALRILPAPDRGRFTFEDAKGGRAALDLAPVVLSSIEWVSAVDPKDPAAPLYRRKGDLNYWFEYLADSKTLYVKYNRCADMEGLPFEKFNEQVWEAAAKNTVERFVVDLRHNAGGNSAIFRPMLKAIGERPEINRRGRLFALIGRGTFSSGFLNALELRKHTQALLVGEPTGQRPNAHGELRNFTLTHSGLKVFYSTKFYKFSDEDTPSLMPDITVELAAADFFNGRDPVLAAVLAVREK
jgi:hypothetical protein